RRAERGAPAADGDERLAHCLTLEIGRGADALLDLGEAILEPAVGRRRIPQGQLPDERPAGEALLLIGLLQPLRSLLGGMLGLRGELRHVGEMKTPACLARPAAEVR